MILFIQNCRNEKYGNIPCSSKHQRNGLMLTLKCYWLSFIPEEQLVGRTTVRPKYRSVGTIGGRHQGFLRMNCPSTNLDIIGKCSLRNVNTGLLQQSNLPPEQSAIENHSSSASKWKFGNWCYLQLLMLLLS
jgi:hypothetical protein